MRAPLLLAMVTLAGLGCRRAPAPAPAPMPLEEEHCWWAVLRSSLPPDSVAAHFERAYGAVGLGAIRRTRLADTAWVHTAPVELDGALRTGRAVAYRRGDSTHFRYFVGVALPAGRNVSSTNAAVSPEEAREREMEVMRRGALPLCVRIARAAGFGWTVPPEPTGEESLAVWSPDRR